jgi:hypothetical protein
MAFQRPTEGFREARGERERRQEKQTRETNSSKRFILSAVLSKFLSCLMAIYFVNYLEGQ